MRRISILSAGFMMQVFASLSPLAAQAPTDTFARLPNEEVPGRQIGWMDANSFAAFVRAVETTRPIVVVFGDQTSPLTQKLPDLVLSCPHINQLAGQAVFTYANPRTDEFAHRMASHLKLSVFPTISVLAPNTDKLTELYRIEGFVDAATIAGDLRKVFEARRYWQPSLPQPTSLPAHALAYPGKACTPAGAQRLGLTGNR